MGRTQLWLLASLAFASLIYQVVGDPLNVMVAPNLLRVGTTENIFVECQDCSGGDITVHITVFSYPTQNKQLSATSVTLTSGTNFQGFGQIKISPEDFSKNTNLKQNVVLQAKFPSHVLERVVLVSFHSGYIFIQTDKTLYTPNSRVLYRMFAVTPGMEPVERDDTTDASIDIEIVTPEGVTMPVEIVSVNSKIHSGHYQLGEIVSIGAWKVVAKFHSNPQEIFSAIFEVKEYVLPSFEVKLKPEISFYYVDSPQFTVEIETTYLFGEPVDGTAYVIFGVVIDGQKTSLPSSLRRVSIDEGKGVVVLKREQILNTFENIGDLVGKSIFVAVSVLTENGAEMVEAELRGIQIVKSPYNIHFKRTPKYFKPGMSFDVWVEVLNPDKSPAQGIDVVVDPGNVRGSTDTNGLAKVTVNTEAGFSSLFISAVTNDANLPLRRQASANMTAVPYKSISRNYIHIGVDSANLNLGNNMKVNLNLNRQTAENTDITYLILSKGQLVKYGQYKKRGHVLISLTITITKDMLPSFRIIVYYHINNEVVSDSVWVDVKDSCMGSLKLESLRPVPSYEPRRMFGLKVTGDPGATVGLVAVDKGVYVLNNKHLLTQKKIWDTVEKYDTGCTAGGGQNGLGVFFDAGLLFASSTASGTPDRKESKCATATPNRQKRSTAAKNVTTSLLSSYQDDVQRECCLEGMKEIPLSYTCERRSTYISDGPACIQAFLDCCKKMEMQRTERKEEDLILARSESDENSFMDNNDIVSRTKFPESWLWSDITLPACSPQTATCMSTSLVKNVPLQDSITTWMFNAISLSRSYGICVANPLEVIVRKEFFIDLRLPYSVVRGEQVEIKAILHNYSPEMIVVRVDLLEEENVCSLASKRSKYRQEVKVMQQSTRSIPFIIIPMKEGKFRIEVKASVRDSSLHDGVMKMLQVVPEGVLVKSPKKIFLNPANNSRGGTEVVTINSGIDETVLVPNTQSSTQISVTGREQVSVLVENAISGNSMGSLIYQPSGCGEQNLYHMTLPVIATMYLDNTNQWETLGLPKRKEALTHIMTGYRNELTFRKSDGSFSAFPSRQSCTWLTAYVIKVFAIASNLVAVQRNIVCSAVEFLIVQTQQSNGMFKEVGSMIHGQMASDVLGRDSDASMTAFCLIALQESRRLCTNTVNDLSTSIDKAVAYLESRLPSIKNPYAVAMTSYALANENKLNKDILYRFASPDSSHWTVPRGHIYTLEATAYALLALVKTKSFVQARPVVRWFNKQKKVGGGFGSTQATIMVYQAVAEYWTSAKESDYNLNVDILLPGRSRPDKYHFTRDNHYATRTSKISNINQNLTVTATGTGEATVTLVSLYYALPKEKKSDCQKFDLSVELVPEKIGGEEDIYKLKIHILFKDQEQDAGMSILDIGLLTGFTPDTNDLNLLSKGRARTIAKYEMNTVLSERGSLIIYLDKVSNKHQEEISFRVIQKMKVGVLQPAAVSVYEYYDQRHCVKFYHPARRSGELLMLCTAALCTCAEENCSMQKKGRISNELRLAKACESTLTSKIDFVYKTKLENYTSDVSADRYSMRILDIIKEGSVDMGLRGNLRTFLGYTHCRESLGLREGGNYLIMGSSQDIYRDTKNELYQYVLGEKTWIEYWPTEEECQSEKNRATCVSLQGMEQQLKLFGCNQ